MVLMRERVRRGLRTRSILTIWAWLSSGTRATSEPITTAPPTHRRTHDQAPDRVLREVEEARRVVEEVRGGKGPMAERVKWNAGVSRTQALTPSPHPQNPAP